MRRRSKRELESLIIEALARWVAIQHIHPSCEGLRAIHAQPREKGYLSRIRVLSETDSPCGAPGQG
jgi:hypothetical protein